MAKPKAPQSKPSNDPEEENKEHIKETLKQASNNPAVKDALNKEKQPARADDLSPLHNTQNIGTSGGDQRIRENDLDEGGS